MRRTPYDKQAVIADIAEQKLTPIEIADKYGLTLSNVYTIRSVARRRGVINSRGQKTMTTRMKDEASVLTPELRERIKDLREKELTTTEITTLLKSEGTEVIREDVEKVMARAASDYLNKMGKKC